MSEKGLFFKGSNNSIRGIKLLGPIICHIKANHTRFCLHGVSSFFITLVHHLVNGIAIASFALLAYGRSTFCFRYGVQSRPFMKDEDEEDADCMCLFFCLFFLNFSQFSQTCFHDLFLSFICLMQ